MRRLTLALTLVLGSIAAAPQAAAAFHYTVNSTDDEPDVLLGNEVCDSTPGPGTECTLRAAIQEANAGAVADVVLLPDLGADYDLTATGAGENAAVTGDLDVTRNLTIQGTGQPVIDGLGSDRVLHVGPSNSPAVVLNGVEVRNGGGVENGGGILVDAGSLGLVSSTVAASTAVSGAGSAAGGGIRIASPGSHSFSASTLSGNTATGSTGAQGGGLMLDAGASASFTNSTVSGNTADSTLGTARGGGIASLGGAALSHTTLHLNSATGPVAAGGSLAALAGGISLRATIVSNGSADPGSENCSAAGGGFVTLGYNVEAPATAAAAQCGTSLAAADRFAIEGGVAALGDRGGPTQTHALLSNSPALDAIPTCFPTNTDQRGEPRPSGAACEAGSFERQVPPPPGTGCFGKTPTILGTPAKQTLVGTPGPDVIVAEAGSDLVKGGAGKDLICAGKGADRVFGGAGSDKLAGEDGADRLFGQGGRDQLLGNSGRDVLRGGKDRDSLNGGARRDNCRGTRGDRLRNC